MKLTWFAILLTLSSTFLTPPEEGQKSLKNAAPIEELIQLDSTWVAASTVVSGLNVPWEITWGPDNWIWFTEQGGTISRVNPATGQKKVLLRIPDVFRKKSYGLLGMAVHPDFKKSPYVFVDYTYLKDSTILSRLVRYTYTKDTLVNPVTLLQDIPGATYHNGSRVIIAPDGKLMMSTGDAGRGKAAQDHKSLVGKILRFNIDGSIPADNPDPGSPVWSRGHRNPQGLVFAANGKLYSSEHGEASSDELNIIEKGANYGWPDVEGACTTPQEKAYCEANAITEPLRDWTTIIAPSGIDYYSANAIPEWQNSMLVTTLKTCSFRVLRLNKAGDKIVSEQTYFEKGFGRLRDICIAPNGDIYAATSNRDWNPTCEGFPKPQDDRIIRLYRTRANPKLRQEILAKKASENHGMALSAGHRLYNLHCLACHKKDGNGFENTFPPLQGTPFVEGDKKALITAVLHGLSGPRTVKGITYNQQMPAFHFLSDSELADVLTFVRSSFGNKAAAITPAEVASARATAKQ